MYMYDSTCCNLSHLNHTHQTLNHSRYHLMSVTTVAELAEDPLLKGPHATLAPTCCNLSHFHTRQALHHSRNHLISRTLVAEFTVSPNPKRQHTALGSTDHTVPTISMTTTRSN